MDFQSSGPTLELVEDRMDEGFGIEGFTFIYVAGFLKSQAFLKKPVRFFNLQKNLKMKAFI